MYWRTTDETRYATWRERREKNRILWQPLQRCVIAQRQVLLKVRLRAAAAVKFTGTRHGDQRMAIRVNYCVDDEFVTADDTTGWMKQTEVAGFFFGIKRTLNSEQTDMMTGGERGFPVQTLKTEIQHGLPAFFILW